MAPTHNTTFGVSVEPMSSPANEKMHPTLSLMDEKTLLTSTIQIPNPSPCETPPHEPANPFSYPINTHSPSPAGESQLSVPKHDIEACPSSPYIISSNTSWSSLAAGESSKECAMWPTQQTLKEKAKTRRKAQGCGPMKKLSRKQKLLVKLLIALVVVGLAVGLGVGISRAVGEGVWKGEDRPNVAIPQGGNRR